MYIEILQKLMNRLRIVDTTSNRYAKSLPFDSVVVSF